MPDFIQTDYVYDTSGKLTSTGSANAYVVTISNQLNGYFQGFELRFKANFTNSGSASLNVATQSAPAGLGAVTLKKYGGATNLASGDIVSGGTYTVVHDGTNFQVLELQPSVATVTGFPMTAPGDRWGVLTPVGADGVMEVGRYLDFHNSDGDTSDNAVRLETNGGTTGLFETPSGGSLKRIVSLINSTLAQGDVIYYDGSNFVRLAAGTSGNFLQTQGAGANPQWAAVAAAGLVLLTSGTVSSAATLDIVLTSYTAYRGLIFELMNFVPATDNVNLLCRFSTNGGSSYDAGAGNYRYSGHSTFSNGAAAIPASGSATEILLAGGAGAGSDIGNGTAEGVTIMARLMQQTNTAIKTRIDATGSYYASGDHHVSLRSGGHRNTAQDTDAIRFLMSSGNIASGAYAVYGLV